MSGPKPRLCKIEIVYGLCNLLIERDVVGLIASQPAWSSFVAVVKVGQTKPKGEGEGDRRLHNSTLFPCGGVQLFVYDGQVRALLELFVRRCYLGKPVKCCTDQRRRGPGYE